MSFKWRTEDERGWDHEFHSPPPELGPSRRLPLALLALALILAGAALWRGVERRVESRQAALEEDVHSSYALALRAAEADDAELLTTVLSGRNDKWTQRQLRLLDNRLLFARAATPFGLEPNGVPGTITAVTFSPDLEEAFVTSSYTYTLSTAANKGFATLKQTLVFRRGGQRWLLSPPDPDFWGPWQSQSATHVSLTFHGRDAQTVAQMLPILNDAASAVCEALARSCPAGRPFEVRLDDDAETLRRLQNDRLPTFRFGELALPSPSLVGDGDDPASREALYRGYAVYLQVAVAQELLDFDCCQGAQFMDALAMTMAQELGYGAGPLYNADYVQMAESLPSLREFNRLWWGAYRAPFTAQDRAQVALFVDFLRQQSDASLADLQVALSNAFGFWDWIQPFVAYDVVAGRAALETSWRDFLLARANAALQVTEEERPAQALRLICEDESGQRGLYSYDPATEQWIYERVVQGRAPALVPTPGDDGVVLFDRVAADPARLPARLLRQGQEIPLPGDLAPAYTLPSDPQGQFMPMWQVAQSGRTVDGVVLLDLASCEEARFCRQRSLPGLPSWSPSGEQLLVWDPDSGRVAWRSRDLLHGNDGLPNSSQLPFWLDEQTAGIVSPEGNALQTVDLQRDAPWAARDLLLLDAVLASLGRVGDGRNWRFAQFYRVPGQQGAILGALTLPESGARHYFVARFDGARQLMEIMPMEYVPQLLVTAPDALISVDGAFMALHLFPETIFDARFILRDLRSGAVVLDTRSPYFTGARAYDWSTDGRWLARIGVNTIELLSGTGDKRRPLSRRFVSTGRLQCTSIAWQQP